MEISILLVFALIAIIVIVKLHGDYQAKEFDRQFKLMELKLQQDNANFQRWIQQKTMEFQAMQWQISEKRNHELALKRFELDLSIATSNHNARVLELENQKIANMVNFALNQNSYKQDTLLRQIDSETQKFKRDIELLSHLSTKEAERKKNKLLYDLDLGLDNITKDLNSPWG